MKIGLKIFFLLIVSVSFGQDINFSQFYELPLLRNPALAGIYKGDYRLYGAFRSQWSSVTTPYVSQALGGEIRTGFPKNSSNYTSVGLQVTNEMAGDSRFSKLQMLPVVAYHQLLNSDYNTYATIGLMVGPVQQKFDRSRLQFDDQFVNGSFNPVNPTQQVFPKTQRTYFDWTVGLSLNGSLSENVDYYLGSAYFHFLKPNVAFIKNYDTLHSKLVFNGGITFPVSESGNYFIIYADYFRQGGNSQGQGGIIFKHVIEEVNDQTKSLSVGALVRPHDAITPVIKLEYPYNFGVGLSYDINISKLYNGSHSRGGFELTLSYRGFMDINKGFLKTLNCPKF